MNGNGYQPKKSIVKPKPPKTGSVIESPMEFFKAHHPDTTPLYKYWWKKWLQLYQFKKIK